MNSSFSSVILLLEQSELNWVVLLIHAVRLDIHISEATRVRRVKAGDERANCVVGGQNILNLLLLFVINVCGSKQRLLILLLFGLGASGADQFNDAL